MAHGGCRLTGRGKVRGVQAAWSNALHTSPTRQKCRAATRAWCAGTGTGNVEEAMAWNVAEAMTLLTSMVSRPAWSIRELAACGPTWGRWQAYAAFAHRHPCSNGKVTSPPPFSQVQHPCNIVTVAAAAAPSAAACPPPQLSGARTRGAHGAAACSP
eukprot:350264-Chlamydomonas_euryale.AAC.1